ncbi:MAG: preprotein translocase subunit SecD, partial [Clostridia bacterium]|nr:preprotein translocase subunit SecD [Clostridia bacterium]
MKCKSVIGLILCVIVIAGLIYTAAFGFTLQSPFSGNEYKFPSVLDENDGIKKGLDLVGGSIISFEANVASPSAEDMDAAEQVLRNRLDSQGYFDAVVTRQGSSVIRVEIPNIDDPEAAVQLLKADAVLKFTDADGNVIMEGGTDVEKAVNAYGQLNDSGEQGYYVQLTLTGEGQKKFADATAVAASQTDGKNIIKIMLDDTEISSPRVSEKIDSRTCIITGNFTEQSAKILADQIQSGQLPFSLKESELRSVGPSLGDKALATSLKAAMIGIIIVLIFMLIVYTLPGLVADLALLLYIALVALIMAGYFMPGNFTATLTLPGIAGIILSIGMAVDANVIIFERIKEELRMGKTIKSAVASGYKRATTAIVDANIT